MKGLRELVTFGLVGVANTAVGLGTILILQEFAGFSPYLANICGYAAGLTNSFFMNRAFTFRDADRSAAAVGRFLVAFAIAYAANIAVLTAMLAAVPAVPMAGQAVAMVVYTLIFFVLAKWFVFRKRAAT